LFSFGNRHCANSVNMSSRTSPHLGAGTVAKTLHDLQLEIQVYLYIMFISFLYLFKLLFENLTIQINNKSQFVTLLINW
jgi:hypothetical protein